MRITFHFYSPNMTINIQYSSKYSRRMNFRNDIISKHTFPTTKDVNIYAINSTLSTHAVDVFQSAVCSRTKQLLCSANSNSTISEIAHDGARTTNNRLSMQLSLAKTKHCLRPIAREKSKTSGAQPEPTKRRISTPVPMGVGAGGNGGSK